MTWVDGILVLLFALAAAAALSSRREAGEARLERERLEEELTSERQARDADRAAFAEERKEFLYDHRQLVSRRVLLEGVPPLDEPLRVESEDAQEAFDEDTAEGVEQALAALGGGRMRGQGRIAATRDRYDELLAKQEQIQARKHGVGAASRMPQEPVSPYAPGERPLTPDDFAAIDDAANH